MIISRRPAISYVTSSHHVCRGSTDFLYLARSLVMRLILAAAAFLGSCWCDSSSGDVFHDIGGSCGSLPRGPVEEGDRSRFAMWVWLLTIDNCRWRVAALRRVRPSPRNALTSTRPAQAASLASVASQRQLGRYLRNPAQGIVCPGPRRTGIVLYC